jgi:hypothetical protein
MRRWLISRANPDRLGRQRWFTLLAQRIATHPSEVIEPYRNLVEAQVNDSGDKHLYVGRCRCSQPFGRPAGRPDRTIGSPLTWPSSVTGTAAGRHFRNPAHRR